MTILLPENVMKFMMLSWVGHDSLHDYSLKRVQDGTTKSIIIAAFKDLIQRGGGLPMELLKTQVDPDYGENIINMFPFLILFCLEYLTKFQINLLGKLINDRSEYIKDARKYIKTRRTRDASAAAMEMFRDGGEPQISRFLTLLEDDFPSRIRRGDLLDDEQIWGSRWWKDQFLWWADSLTMAMSNERKHDIVLYKLMHIKDIKTPQQLLERGLQDILTNHELAPYIFKTTILAMINDGLSSEILDVAESDRDPNNARLFFISLNEMLNNNKIWPLYITNQHITYLEIFWNNTADAKEQLSDRINELNELAKKWKEETGTHVPLSVAENQITKAQTLEEELAELDNELDGIGDTGASNQARLRIEQTRMWGEWAYEFGARTGEDDDHDDLETSPDEQDDDTSPSPAEQGEDGDHGDLPPLLSGTAEEEAYAAAARAALADTARVKPLATPQNFITDAELEAKAAAAEAKARHGTLLPQTSPPARVDDPAAQAAVVGAAAVEDYEPGREAVLRAALAEIDAKLVALAEAQQPAPAAQQAAAAQQQAPAAAQQQAPAAAQQQAPAAAQQQAEPLYDFGVDINAALAAIQVGAHTGSPGTPRSHGSLEPEDPSWSGPPLLRRAHSADDMSDTRSTDTQGVHTHSADDMSDTRSTDTQGVHTHSADDMSDTRSTGSMDGGAKPKNKAAGKKGKAAAKRRVKKTKKNEDVKKGTVAFNVFEVIKKFSSKTLAGARLQDIRKAT